jgi:hypothetical protein
MKLLESAAFVRSLGPVPLLQTLSVWERCPIVIRALAEQWPVAERLAARAVVEMKKRATRGWFLPSPGQAARLAMSLEEYRDRLPPSSEPLVREVEEVLCVIEERDHVPL